MLKVSGLCGPCSGQQPQNTLSTTVVGHVSWQWKVTVWCAPVPSHFADCESEVGAVGSDDIMQQPMFEVPVLKEPLTAIRISFNKRLRNIGWFLAFASPSLPTN